MIYLKSVLVGIVAAFAISTVWFLVRVVVPLVVPFLFSRIAGGGSGGAGVVIGSGEILAVAIVSFAVGFWWKLRRIRLSH